MKVECRKKCVCVCGNNREIIIIDLLTLYLHISYVIIENQTGIIIRRITDNNNNTPTTINDGDDYVVFCFPSQS